MVTVALWVRLEAKPGREADLEAFLRAGAALAEAEPETLVWFASGSRRRHLGFSTHSPMKPDGAHT